MLKHPNQSKPAHRTVMLEAGIEHRAVPISIGGLVLLLMALLSASSGF